MVGAIRVAATSSATSACAVPAPAMISGTWRVFGSRAAAAPAATASLPTCLNFIV
jgi:hypothetical protein